MAPKKTVNFILRCPPEIHAKLVKRAARDRRSIQQTVVLAIEEFLKKP